jgi:hypothetical protein
MSNKINIHANGVNEYYCSNCNYHTDELFCFKEHLLSKRHNDTVPNDVRKPPEFKRKIFCCEDCKNVYLSKRSLQNHFNKDESENSDSSDRSEDVAPIKKK